jgi:hypothetical protein
MFMDPRSIPATLEGMRSIVSDTTGANLNPLFATEEIPQVNSDRPN